MSTVWSSAYRLVNPSLRCLTFAVNSKDESKKASERISKLTKELKAANTTIKTLDEELQKAIVSVTFTGENGARFYCCNFIVICFLLNLLFFFQ